MDANVVLSMILIQLLMFEMLRVLLLVFVFVEMSQPCLTSRSQKWNTDPDNVCAEFHSTEVGWELDDLDDLDAVVTEQNDDNMLKMPAVFRAEEFFIKENGWSSSSRSYLINKHNDRTGLKGIVYKALIDHQRMLGFESLSEGEVHFHLLSTIIHYNSS